MQINVNLLSNHLITIPKKSAVKTVETPTSKLKALSKKNSKSQHWCCEITSIASNGFFSCSQNIQGTYPMHVTTLEKYLKIYMMVGENMENRIERLRKYIDDVLLNMKDTQERRCGYIHLYGVSQACAMIALKRN